PYEFIANTYRRPVVVAGFEPLDILRSIQMLLRQLAEGRCEVENQYTRVVGREGNRKSLEAIQRTMELRPYFEWRGLGFISHSALRVRERYARFDAERIFEIPGGRVADPKACQCGEVLKGVLKPWECKVFGTACTPETPIGTCMVSSEGACAAYYNYRRVSPGPGRGADGERGGGNGRGRGACERPAAWAEEAVRMAECQMSTPDDRTAHERPPGREEQVLERIERARRRKARVREEHVNL